MDRRSRIWTGWWMGLSAIKRPECRKESYTANYCGDPENCMCWPVIFIRIILIKRYCNGVNSGRISSIFSRKTFCAIAGRRKKMPSGWKKERNIRMKHWACVLSVPRMWEYRFCFRQVEKRFFMPVIWITGIGWMRVPRRSGRGPRRISCMSWMIFTPIRPKWMWPCFPLIPVWEKNTCGVPDSL